MAGTDRNRELITGGPAIILVEPQLGENIGMVARAMANFGLAELRLVNPRDGWPSEKARAAASKADHVIDAVQVFEGLAEALADLNFVVATTARQRSGRWLSTAPCSRPPALNPRVASRSPSTTGRWRKPPKRKRSRASRTVSSGRAASTWRVIRSRTVMATGAGWT